MTRVKCYQCNKWVKYEKEKDVWEAECPECMSEFYFYPSTKLFKVRKFKRSYCRVCGMPILIEKVHNEWTFPYCAGDDCCY